MSKRLMLSALALVSFSAVGDVIQNPTPTDYFGYTRQRGIEIAKTISYAESVYAGGKRPLWGEAYRTPALPFTAALNQLLVVTGKQSTVPVLALNRWPLALTAQADVLLGMTQSRAEGTAWKDQLLTLHTDYVNTLVTVYTYIESLKREYLLSTSPELVFGQERDSLLQLILALHAQAQGLMRCFESMRGYAPFINLMPYHSAYGKGTWEAMYTQAFFYKLNFDYTASTVFQARDVGQYFTPFVLTPVPGTIQAPAPGVEENPRPGGTPPAEPAYVDNNDRLRQLILSLQNRMLTPEVQANATLKAQIEAILQELRPGLPSLKPLPPKDDGVPAPVAPRDTREVIF